MSKLCDKPGRTEYFHAILRMAPLWDLIHVLLSPGSSLQLDSLPSFLPSFLPSLLPFFFFFFFFHLYFYYLFLPCFFLEVAISNNIILHAPITLCIMCAYFTLLCSLLMMVWTACTCHGLLDSIFAAVDDEGLLLCPAAYISR